MVDRRIDTLIGAAPEQLRARALELGASDALVVSPGQVVTAEWVRMKCLYGGCRTGQCLTCPPHSPTPSQTRALLDEYESVLLLRFDVAGAHGGQRTRCARQQHEVDGPGRHQHAESQPRPVAESERLDTQRGIEERQVGHARRVDHPECVLERHLVVRAGAGAEGGVHATATMKRVRGASQCGHTQYGGSSANGVPGRMPASRSPSAGS